MSREALPPRRPRRRPGLTARQERFFGWTAGALVLAVGAAWIVGLREAVLRAYSLPERPGRAELERIGEPWRPYRSAATLFLWRSLSAPPA